MSRNRLAGEKSPYLLQHADNPVDWMPWGEEAFAQARRRGCPILLSIGYATCHWCHVMERESFSDPAVAAAMNAGFVCVKLDREERPDVDKLYMAAVQAMGRQGGWPLNVFLTPDLKPFFGGTYFPPRPRWGQAGWLQLVERVSGLWSERRAEVEADAGRLAEAVAALAAPPEPGTRPGPEVLRAAEAAFEGAFDPEHGGFGGAPKFPMPSYQRFLLRRGARGSARSRELAIQTLLATARGGVFDQVGGGFHRYSTDAAWRVPHFEKMLYDNAQLLENLADAALAAPEGALSGVLRRTVEYLARDLRSPEGAFCSAEDADSRPPGPPARDADGRAAKAEGAFYLWTKAELDALLGPRAAAFAARHGVELEGNAPHDPHDEFRGKNILYDREPRAMPEEAAARARAALLAARSRRPRPSLDDKILAGWNGLALTGLARAHVATGDPAALRLAEGAAEFLRTRMWDVESRTLWRRWREGQKAVPGFAEDYACVAQGLLDLYEADFDSRWLSWSLELVQEALRRFRAPGGGVWQTAEGASPELPARALEDHDGVEPAASSVLADAVLRLHALTGREDLRAFAEETLSRFGSLLAERPLAMPYMLCALDRALGVARTVVIAGLDRPGGRELLAAARGRLRLDLSLAAFTDGTRKDLAALLPAVAAMPAAPRAAAYLCAGGACGLPIADPAELSRRLDE